MRESPFDCPRAAEGAIPFMIAVSVNLVHRRMSAVAITLIPDSFASSSRLYGRFRDRQPRRIAAARFLISLGMGSPGCRSVVSTSGFFRTYFLGMTATSSRAQLHFTGHHERRIREFCSIATTRLYRRMRPILGMVGMHDDDFATP